MQRDAREVHKLDLELLSQRRAQEKERQAKVIIDKHKKEIKQQQSVVTDDKRPTLTGGDSRMRKSTSTEQSSSDLEGPPSQQLSTQTEVSSLTGFLSLFSILLPVAILLLLCCSLILQDPKIRTPSPQTGSHLAIITTTSRSSSKGNPTINGPYPWAWPVSNLYF